MINWQAAQARLTARGYPCGAPDGDPGPLTFTALYAYAAGRHADEAIHVRGEVAAKRFPDFGMVTPPRIAEFIAQCGNETGGFRVFEENLNYRAPVMLRLWPSHFTPEQAAAAEGHPIEIASRAYGGRMGNDPYPSHDGYTYRGRYDLQLTGKANYKHFGDLLGIDLVTNPDAAPPEDSPLIALEFWKLGNVNAYCDQGNFLATRGITNVGSAHPAVPPIGLANVALIRNHILEIFG